MEGQQASATPAFTRIFPSGVKALRLLPAAVGGSFKRTLHHDQKPSTSASKEAGEFSPPPATAQGSSAETLSKIVGRRDRKKEDRMDPFLRRSLLSRARHRGFRLPERKMGQRADLRLLPLPLIKGPQCWSEGSVHSGDHCDLSDKYYGFLERARKEISLNKLGISKMIRKPK